MRYVIGIAAAVLLFATTAEAARIEKKTLESKGIQRTYYLFVPDSVTKDHPAPLLVLLHGSGRDGRSLVDPWQRLAAKEGIILAAPDSTNRQFWSSPEDGPVLLRDLVEAMKAAYPVDEKRVYLFGHSAGAGFALQMGSIESEYFAAVAIHAGAVLKENFSIFDYASRKIPFGLWVGDRDPLFPVADVRGTSEELERRGFPVKLTVVRFHDHNYYAAAKSLNEEIWDFLKTQALTKPQKFSMYANS